MGDVIKLRQFAEEGHVAKEWTPAPFEPKFDGVILAFDQSLAMTGYAVLIGKRVTVTGMCGTAAMSSGTEDTVLRATAQFANYDRILEAMQPALVVYERPPVSSAAMRSESSLTAAVALSIACERRNMTLVPGDARRAKKRLTNNANAKKPAVQAAVTELLGLEKKPNQAICDALAIAMIVSEEWDGRQDHRR